MAFQIQTDEIFRRRITTASNIDGFVIARGRYKLGNDVDLTFGNVSIHLNLVVFFNVISSKSLRRIQTSALAGHTDDGTFQPRWNDLL